MNDTRVIDHKRMAKKAKHEKSENLGANVSTWVLFFVLFVISVMMVGLIVWGFFASVKEGTVEFYQNPVWAPEGPITEWKWDNYVKVFQNFQVQEAGEVYWFEDLLWNSILFSCVGPLVSTFTCCFMGYVLQRFDYKYSRVWYAMILVVMIIPLQGTTAGMLRVMNVLHVFDTFWGLWLQSFSFCNMKFLIFYAAYKSIPHDYEEAAYIDGASEITVFTRIMLPMVKNIFITYFLLGFIANWNDWATPLVYLPTHPTMAYGVYTLANSNLNDFAYTPMRMATCFVSIIPTTIIFIFFRDKVMAKVSLGGVKE